MAAPITLPPGFELDEAPAEPSDVQTSLPAGFEIDPVEEPVAAHPSTLPEGFEIDEPSASPARGVPVNAPTIGGVPLPDSMLPMTPAAAAEASRAAPVQATPEQRQASFQETAAKTADLRRRIEIAERAGNKEGAQQLIQDLEAVAPGTVARQEKQNAQLRTLTKMGIGGAVAGPAALLTSTIAAPANEAIMSREIDTDLPPSDSLAQYWKYGAQSFRSQVKMVAKKPETVDDWLKFQESAAKLKVAEEKLVPGEGFVRKGLQGLANSAPAMIDTLVQSGGFAPASFKQWADQGTAMILSDALRGKDVRSMSKEQLDEFYYMARGAGALYAGVEFGQSPLALTKALGFDVGGNIAGKVIKMAAENPVFKRKLVQIGMRFAGRTAAEIGEEGLQQPITDLTTDAIKTMAENPDKGKVAATWDNLAAKWWDYTKGSAEAMKQAIIPAAGMILGGKVVETPFRLAAAQEAKKKAAAPGPQPGPEDAEPVRDIEKFKQEWREAELPEDVITKLADNYAKGDKAGEDAIIAEYEASQAAAAREAAKTPATATGVPTTPAQGPAGEGGKAADVATPETTQKDEPIYSQNSTQANVRGPVADAVKAVAAKIPDADVMPTKQGVGREDDPHITLKYGVEDNASESIKGIARAHPPITATLGKMSVFPPSPNSDGAAVVHVEIDSPELHALRKQIDEAAGSRADDFDYKPHITVAYVKPEASAKYEGGTDLEGQKVTLDSIAVSDRNGKQIELKLEGKPDAAAPKIQVDRADGEAAPDTSAGTVRRDGESDTAGAEATRPPAPAKGTGVRASPDVQPQEKVKEKASEVVPEKPEVPQREREPASQLQEGRQAADEAPEPRQPDVLSRQVQPAASPTVSTAGGVAGPSSDELIAASNKSATIRNRPAVKENALRAASQQGVKTDGDFVELWHASPKWDAIDKSGTLNGGTFFGTSKEQASSQVQVDGSETRSVMVDARAVFPGDYWTANESLHRGQDGKWRVTSDRGVEESPSRPEKEVRDLPQVIAPPIPLSESAAKPQDTGREPTITASGDATREISPSIGKGTKPATLAQIRGGRFRLLRDIAKHALYENGKSVLESSGAKSTASLRQALMDHHEWYNSIKGIKKRARMSEEAKQKIRDTKARRITEKENAHWAEFHKDAATELAEKIKSGALLPVGAEVYVEDGDVIYRVVDHVPDVGVSGDVKTARVRGWSYSVTENGETQRIVASDQVAEAPAEDIDAEISFLDDIEGAANEADRQTDRQPAAENAQPLQDEPQDGDVAQRGDEAGRDSLQPRSEESLTLESPTDADIEAGKRREKIRKEQDARLTAKPIDTTGDLFDADKADNPLFAPPTPKPKGNTDENKLSESPDSEAGIRERADVLSRRRSDAQRAIDDIGRATLPADERSQEIPRDWREISPSDELAEHPEFKEVESFLAKFGLKAHAVFGAFFQAVQFKNDVLFDSRLSRPGTGEMMSLAKHELFHHFYARGVRGARELAALVDRASDTFRKYKEWLNTARMARGASALPDHVIAEEIAADFYSGRAESGIFLDDAFKNPVDAMQISGRLDQDTTETTGPPGGDVRFAVSPAEDSRYLELAKDPAESPDIRYAEPFTTSTKNAQTDKEREKYGLTPAMQVARREFGTVWNDAMAEIDADDTRQERLIEELAVKPRPVTDTENAILLHAQITEQLKYNRAAAMVNENYDTSNLNAVDDWNIALNLSSNRLQRLFDIIRATGTANARGLNSRRMMANDDFTLAAMETQVRADKGGKPLTKDERAALQKIADDYKKESESLARRLASAEERLANSETDAFIRAQMLERLTAEQQELLRDFNAAKKELARESDKLSEAYARNYVAAFKAVVGIVADPVRRVDAVFAPRNKESADKASAARARLLAKLSSTQPRFAEPGMGAEMPEYSMTDDLVAIADDQISNGMMEKAQFEKYVADNFGKLFTPDQVNEAWQRGWVTYADSVFPLLEGAEKEKASKLKDARKPVSTEDKIRKRIVGGATAFDIRQLVQALAADFIRKGVKQREPLIDAVHGALTPMLPTITRRETMDAISGYGDYTQLDQDEIKVQLRDLKGQMQQVAKIEDLEAKRPLKKTGVEHREKSDAERRLEQQVNELKRRLGVRVTDPATQLKSALDAIKTRLKHQIDDLTHQLETGTKIVKTRTPILYDTAATDLKAKRDALKAEFDEMFGKPGLTDEQRIRMATASVERSIEEYERRIREGDLKPRIRVAITPETPALKALRARRDALKEQLAELRALANPKATPEERALAAFKKRSTNRIAELNEKIATGDVSTRKRKPITLDPEAQLIRFRLEAIQKRFNEMRMQAQLAARSIPAKIFGGIGEVFNTSRAMMTSFDLSGILRQGGFIVLGNPARGIKAIPEMLRAFVSERAEHASNEQILARANAPLYAQAKLFLHQDGNSLSKMEEAFMARWIKKIPRALGGGIIRGSQRAYTTFLNRLRADTFDAMVNALGHRASVTEEEAMAIANYINVATGRGTLGKFEQSGVLLSTFFFAPRLVASRFQLLAGQPLYGGTARTKALVAKEYAKYLTAILIIYALAAQAFDDDDDDKPVVELDTRSSDLGKIRIGETRVDLLSGLAQATVFASRLLPDFLGGGKVKKASGEFVSLNPGDVSYVGKSRFDIITRFLRTKLSPAAGGIINLLVKEDLLGRPVDPASEAVRQLMPLTFRDIRDAMVEQGVPAGTALAALALLGAGMQTYNDDQVWAGVELSEFLDEKDVRLPSFKTTITINTVPQMKVKGVDTKMTQDQYDQWVYLSQQLIRKRMMAAVPEMRSYSPEDAKEASKKIVKDARADAKKALESAARNPSYDPESVLTK